MILFPGFCSQVVAAVSPDQLSRFFWNFTLEGLAKSYEKNPTFSTLFGDGCDIGTTPAFKWTRPLTWTLYRFSSFRHRWIARHLTRENNDIWDFINWSSALWDYWDCSKCIFGFVFSLFLEVWRERICRIGLIGLDLGRFVEKVIPEKAERWRKTDRPRDVLGRFPGGIIVRGRGLGGGFGAERW